MTIEYKREMNRNYMVIKPDHLGSGKYAEKMLAENRIPGLLDFYEKRMDDQVRFYYDITSRQPLNRLLEVRALNGQEIRRLLSDILFTLKQLERFLLDEGQLFLEPEYIYIEPDSFQCFLCLIPGQYVDFSEKFLEFTKTLLDHVNHTDTEAVVLAFGIFQESRKANFSMENIDLLMRQNPPRSDGAVENAVGLETESRETEKWRAEAWKTGDQEPGRWETGDRERGNCGAGDQEWGKWRTRDRERGNWRSGNQETGSWEHTSAKRQRGNEFGADDCAPKENSFKRGSAFENNYAGGIKKEKYRKKNRPGKAEHSIQTETEPGTRITEKFSGNKKRRIKKVEIGGMIFIMLLIPAVLVALNGFSALIRYKWVIAGAEAGIIVLMLAIRESWADPEDDPEGDQNGAPDMEHSIGGAQFRDREDRDINSFHNQSEAFRDKGEDWESTLRGGAWTQQPEEELQTVLLTAGPEKTDCRRLVPVMGGEEILISYFPFIIGKNRELADFCLEDSAVSRLHLRIDNKEDQYIVTDLNSTNGTRLEGRMLEANESCNIKIGEVIEIAGRAFRFF